MSWLNSDRYKEGYNEGFKDAQNGKKRNTLSFKAGIGSVFAFDNKYYQETYIKGYQQGYTDGLRKKNKLFQNNNSKTNNMANNQTSVAHQIELLEELKSYLHGFQERLAVIADKYENKVDSLHDGGGMTKEQFEVYKEECLEETKRKIQILINQINDEDIHKVEKLIQNWEILLDNM